MKRIISIHKLLITALAALALLASVGAVTAFALTPEEEAIAKRIEESLSKATIISSGSSGGGIASQPSTEPIDLEEYAQESIALTNQKRANAGQNELAADEEMMKLAAIRAKELAEKYNHERPDGTRVSQEYYWGEIINRQASTPSVAIESWMASTKGHKEMMLSDRYQSIGAGCYQADDGSVYWVQLFSR